MVNAIPGKHEKCSPSARNPCSPSSRNRVRHHPGIVFAFIQEPRSPSPGIRTATPTSESGGRAPGSTAMDQPFGERTAVSRVAASPDRMRIEREYRSMAEGQRYPYLECDRCVPAALLSSPRFRGRMRIDARGNTVFPHFDAAGLCVYEIKNRGFTGFAAGGKKGLSPLTRSLMPRSFRTLRLGRGMPAWAAGLVRGKWDWSRRPSLSCQRGPRLWRRSMPMKQDAGWRRRLATSLAESGAKREFTFRQRKERTGIRSC